MFDGGARSLKRRLLSATTGGYIGRDSGNQIVVHALKDVSAQIEHGDRVALVGHNGAGKTTMLRVMAGIYEPMAGRVEIVGRVASLFDLSLGMDGDQTGSQNIMLRGMYLGLSKAEILARTDEIAEFTELGPFLDFPLRTYSAGMHARLGFAISTCVRPEILLLDEGISAGDAAFMQKAQKRVAEFVQEAGIVVLASHTESFVRDTCNKSILLEHGQVVLTGTVDEVLSPMAVARQRRARDITFRRARGGCRERRTPSRILDEPTPPPRNFTLPPPPYERCGDADASTLRDAAPEDVQRVLARRDVQKDRGRDEQPIVVDTVHAERYCPSIFGNSPSPSPTPWRDLHQICSRRQAAPARRDTPRAKNTVADRLAAADEYTGAPQSGQNACARLLPLSAVLR